MGAAGFRSRAPWQGSHSVGQPYQSCRQSSSVDFVNIQLGSLSPDFHVHHGCSLLKLHVLSPGRNLFVSFDTKLEHCSPSSYWALRSRKSPLWIPERHHIYGRVAYDHVDSSGVESLPSLCHIRESGTDGDFFRRNAFRELHVHDETGKHWKRISILHNQHACNGRASDENPDIC